MTRAKTLIKFLAAEELRQLLSYDPVYGIFRWRVSRSGVIVGGVAGHNHVGPKSSTIYIRITIDGVRYWAHDLAWLYVYGEWPQSKLDHKDRDGSNNAIDNLRYADKSQNIVNRGLFRNNSSGCTGVTARFGKWSAKIEWRGVVYQLGTFVRFVDAVAARKAAEQKYFGEFAATGDQR